MAALAIALGVMAGLALVLWLAGRAGGATFDGPDDPARFDWDD